MYMQQNSSPRKTSTIGMIIASICIILYMVALISASIRIYLDVDQRRAVIEQEFNFIADIASNAGVLGFMDGPFIDTISDALSATRTLEALIISGPDGEYAFERRKDSAINWANNSPRFKNRFDLTSQGLFRPLRIHGLRNVNIQGAAVVFDYFFLNKVLKETLILILARLVLAFFTLFIYCVGFCDIIMYHKKSGA
jgi:hypothetical protein